MSSPVASAPPVELSSYATEMESCMRTTGSTRPATVTAVTPKEEVDTENTKGAAVLSKQDAMMDMLCNFNIRLEQLERKVAASGEKSRMYQAPNRKPPDQLRDPIVCRKCGQEGHFARGCAQRKAGND